MPLDAGSERASLELDALLTYLRAQRSDRIREFLKRHEIRRSGTVPELGSRLQEAIESGDISPEHVVGFLDEFEPWGKQHVLFLDGPQGLPKQWTERDVVKERLASHGITILDQRIPILMPTELTLSSIVYETDQLLAITAVEARRSLERTPSLDYEEQRDGQQVVFRGYVQVVTRGIVRLRWNLTANQAYLHITQGAADYDYDGARGRFANLVSPWLPFSQFTLVDLRPVVASLGQIESTQGGLRTHDVRYSTVGGRELQATTATNEDSVLEEESVRDAVSLVANAPGTTGRAGNYFWLKDGANPLNEDMHFIVLASRSRVNLMRPSTQPEVEYVLQRLRSII